MFLKNRLKLSMSFLTDMGDVTVQKLAEGPRSKIKRMVAAVFSSVEIRDAIKSAARELAGDTDAGVRHDVPYHLKSSP